MRKTLDSNYNSLPVYSGSGQIKKALENSKRKEYPKNLGEIEEYLKELNQDEKLTELSSIFALDKIERLFILNKDVEAIKFAEKIIKNNNIKIQDETLFPHMAVSNHALTAIQNIAANCRL